MVALVCFGLHTNKYVVKQYQQALISYFDCEASGLHPGDTNRCKHIFHSIQIHSFPLLFTMMMLFVSLAPVVYLTFLFNWNLFKSKMQALFVTASDSSTQPEHSGAPVLWFVSTLLLLCIYNMCACVHKRNSILTVIIIFVNDMSKQQPEPESSSSSGIDVRSRESSSGNSYSTATTPASLYETDDYYPWSSSDFPSPTSTDSMGGGRVLSNRATDNEIITSFARSSDHVAEVQPPRKVSKTIIEVVLLSVVILGVLSRPFCIFMWAAFLG